MSSALLNTLTDETGTGVSVFNTSPEIITSLTTTTTNFSLLDANATTINFGSGATTINQGANGGILNLGNSGAYTIQTTTGGLTLNSGSNTLTLDSSDTTLNATGLTTITSSGTLGVSATQFNLGAGAPATIGTVSDDNLTLSPNGTGNLVLASDFNSSVFVGNASTPAPLSISGGIGNNSALIVNQLNSGDIITASSSGVTRFRVTNTGELVIGDNNTSFFTTIDPASLTANRTLTAPNEDGTLCLQGSLACGFALGTNYWQLNDKLLSPLNSTYDFAIGGDSTSSAQFAVIGVSNDAPIATLSGSTNNGLSLDANNSTIQSLRNNTLTLGGNTTGDISLSAGNGSGIFNVNSATANLIGTSILNGTSLTAINGGATAINFNEFDVDASTGSITIADDGGLGKITIDGTVLDKDSLDFVAAGLVTSGAGNALSLNSGNNTIIFDSSDTTLNATGLTTITSSPNLTISPTTGAGEITLTSDFDTNVNIGSSSLTPAVLSIGGGYGGNSALIVNQLNSGDIITASSSGVTRFRVTNTGELVIGDNNTSFFTTIDPASLTANRTLTAPNEDGTLCLQGSLACGFALGTNYWQLNDKLLSPLNSTYDFAIGGDSTSSAQFAVIGVSNDAPIATLSGSTNNGLSLDANNSTIQSLRNNTLTLGGNTTGDISLSAGNGSGIFNVNSATANLIGTSILNGTSLTAINGGATAINFNEFDVDASTGSITIADDGGLGKITIDGTVLDKDSLDFVAAGLVTSGAGNALSLNSGNNTIIFDSSDTTLNATGLTTITSSGTLGVSATQFNLGAGAPATIGTVSDDNLTLSPNGTGNLVLASDFNSSVFVGNASTPAPLSISGGIGNNSALIVNQLNSGDIITASSSGVTRFRVTNTGELVIGDNNTSFFTTIDPASLTGNQSISLPNDTGTVCLQYSLDCGFALGEEIWRSNSNILYPLHSFYDLAVGGNSTTSAQFAIINTVYDAPIATLSGSTNNGLSLDANNSTIQSLRNNTLTLGGGTTGNIVLDSGTGIINTPDLTANRAVFTDASSNLVTSALSSALLNTLTDETGTGVSVFNTSPEIITSLTTTTTNFSLLDANATTINFGSGATTINQGANGGILNLGNSGAYTIQTTTGGLTLNSGSNTLTLDSSDTTLNATGLTTITSSGTLGVSATQFNLGAGAPATIGTVSDDNLTLSPNGTGNLVLASDFNSSVFVGNASTPAPLSISGGIGNNSALIVNQLNSGDIITASSSGVTRFRVTNTGELVIGDNNTSFFTTIDPASLTANRTLTAPNEDGTLCLQGSLACGFALGTNYWQLNDKLLSPLNSTYDFAIGGDSTSSAQFAVIGVSNDAPIATLSGSTNNGLSLDANNSTIQSLRNNTLTLGGNTTGDISLSAGNGSGIFNVNSATANLIGTSILNGTSLTAINGGATAINFNEFDVDASTGSITIADDGGLGKITIDGTVLDKDSLDFVAAGLVTSGAGNALSLNSGNNTIIFDSSDTTLNATGLTTITSSGTLGVSATQFNLGAGAPATIGTVSDDNLTLSPNGTGNLVLASDFNSSVFVGNASTPAPLSISGGIGNNSALIVNQLNSGDIITASSSGVTRFRVTNTGELVIGDNNTSFFTTIDPASLTANRTLTAPNEDGTLCLQGSLACGFALGDNYWQLNDKLLSPLNSTYDFAIGGDSTSSAQFAVIGVSNDAPIATLSGSTNNGLSLDANNSTIQSLRNNTLTLGGSSTGDILIDGVTNINGNTDITGTLTSSGLVTANNGLSVTGATNINTSGASATNIGTGGTGVITIGNATSDLSLVDPQWSITGLGAGTFASITSLGTIDAQGDISDSTGNLTLNDAVDISGLATFNGGLTVASGQTTTLASFTNDGGVLYTDTSGIVYETGAGTNVQCLLGGATPTWGTCALGDNYWQINGNLVSPLNSTYDFAIGGDSTSSALFAITNVSSGNPIATLSASTNNNGISIDANNSTIQSLRNNTLTLGGSSTGDILIDGVTNINGNTDITGTLTSSGLVTANNGLSVTGATNINTSGASATNIGTGGTGVITIGNATSDLSLVDPQWSITGLGAGTFASITSLGTIDAQGDISDSTGNLTLNDAVDISGLATFNGGLTVASGQTTTLASFTNDGGVLYTDTSGIVYETGAGTNVQCLLGGATPTWGTCALGDNYWQINGNLVSPINSTYDFGVGGNATSSALFAITNVSSGNPIATLSASTNGNGISLDANNSTIQSLRNNTLTLGGSSTGDILIDGVTNINGNTDITGTLTSSGLVTANNGLSVTGATNINASGASATNIGTGGTGVITIGNATSDLSLVDPQWSITGLGAGTFASITSLGTIDAQGDISDSTGNLTLNDAVDISGLATFNGGLTVASGQTTTLASFTNDGGVLYTDTSGIVYETGAGTNVQCLLGGATPTWGTCALGDNYWQINGNLVSPINSTYDFGVGGNATSSALFAITNVSSGNPIATLSASTNNNGISLDANNSTIQSLRNNTLTLGGSSTGDILIDGITNINGNTDITGTLTSSGLVTANNGLSVTGATNINTSGASATNIGTGGTGVITIGNATSDLSLVDPQWSITGLGAGTFASITSLGTIDAQGDISDSTGNLTLNDAVDISGLATFNGGLTVASGQTTTLASFTNDGGVLYTDTSGIVYETGAGTNVQCLLGGATPTWGTCALGDNYWQINGNLVSPINSTYDFGVGGNATSSALFAVLNVNGPGPAIASVSGNLIVMPNNGAGGYVGIGTTDTTGGVLTINSGDVTGLKILTNDASTNNGLLFNNIVSDNDYKFNAGSNYLSLSIWNNSQSTQRSDIIAFDANTGNVGIGSLAPGSQFSVTRPLSFGATGKALAIFDQIENQDIFTASSSGATKFVINNNGNIQFAGSTNNLATLTTGIVADKEFVFPDFTGVSANICLSTGNCAGAGSSITGSGTATQLAFFDAAQNITSDSNLYFDNTNKRLGIGTSSPFATLDVRGTSGTLPTASISANTSFAGLIVDNSGTGDLFTASKSGSTVFTVANNGNLQFAGSTPYLATLTTGIVANKEFVLPDFTGTTVDICLSSGNCAGAGSGITGGGTATQIAFFDAAQNIISDSNLYFDNTNKRLGLGTSSPLATLDVRTTSGTTPIASISGTTSFAGLVIDNSGLGDIFTASKSGATKFAITNGGNIQFAGENSVLSTINSVAVSTQTFTLPNSSGTFCLSSNNCGFALAVNNSWQINDNFISPANSTYDFGVGGNATSSALFAITNVSSGNPIATLSASTNGNGISIDANNSTIQSLRNNTLTLGGGTTGNIVLDSGTGIINTPDLTANRAVFTDASSNLVTSALSSALLNTLTDETGTGVSVFNTSPEIITSLTTTTTNFSLLDANATTINFGSDATTINQGANGGILNLGNSGAYTIQTTTGGLTLNSGSNTLTLDSSDTTLNATGLTTITSSGTLGVSATQFNLGAGAPATIGTVSDDNLTLSPNGTGNLVLASDFNSSVFVGNASTPAPLSISGGIGNNSALIVNQLNSGDIITASSSGVTRFRVTNTGELVIGDNNTSFFTTIDPASLTANRTLTAPNEDGTLCLQGSLACGFALGTNYWQLNDKLLSPLNSTYDFGVGGNATSSALFAITNVSSGNPIATLSASTNGNGISIDANNSTIQSLRNNTLTLGGNTTGDIVLNGNGNNKVGIGNASPLSYLSVGATPTAPYNTPIVAGFYSPSDGANSVYISRSGVANPQNLAFGVNQTSLYSEIQALQDGIGFNSLVLNKQGGNVGIGTTSPTALLDVAGTASVSGALKLYGTPTIQSTANQTLTLGGDTTGDINLGTTNNGSLNIGNGSGEISIDLQGSDGTGDIYYRDAFGNLEKLTIGGTNNVLTVVAGLPSWTPTSVLNYWQRNDGALAPLNTADDFLLGGASSTSATFAILGNSLARGNQVASLSGDLVLDKAGSLQTTKNQTLTLGGGTTGNIVLDSGTGIINTPDLTANRAVFTDASSNLVTSALSSALLNTLTDETGTGVSVFNTSPEIITSLTTTTTNFSLLDANATTINFGSDATTINQGANGGILNLGNSGAYTIQTTTGGLTLNSGSNTLTLDSSDTTLNATGLTTITSSGTLGVSATQFNLGAGAPATIGTVSDDNLTLSPNGTGNLVLASDFNSSVFVGNASTPAPLSISGGIGNNSALIVNQLNSGDIITASSSGVTRFRVTNTGELVIGDNNTSFFTTIDPASLTANRTLTAPNEDGTLCLQGSANCGFALAVENYWQLNNNLLSPSNTTYDFGVGGNATSSALFAITNVSSGNPIATLSASTNGNGISIDANNSTIQSLRNNTLTLGGGTTGNIVLDSGTGIINTPDLTANRAVFTDASSNLVTSALSSALLNTLTDETGTGVSVFNTSPEIITSLTTTTTNFSLLDANATTINFGSDATTINQGANGGILNLGNSGAYTIQTTTGGLTLNSGSNTLTLDSSDTTLNATGLTTITSSGTLGVSATQFNLGAGAPATIGTVSDDNLTLSPNGTGNLVLASDFNSSVFVGNASTPAPLSISGGIGNNSALIVNQLNSGDIITASSSGVTRFRVTNTGELVIGDNNTSFFTTIDPASLTANRTLTAPNEDGTLCLQGSANCGFALAVENYWQLNNNLLSPSNTTYDFGVGGNATSSALFAITNVSSGNPIATLSASTNGNGISIDANNSTIQSLRNNTLTLGGGTTGNIVLDSGTGIINTPDLTANRAVFTDASSNLVTSALSSALLNTLTDETGTGVSVFNTSPEIITSLTTTTTNFSLLDANATTINFGSDATTINQGANGGILNLGNSGAYTIQTTTGGLTLNSGSNTLTLDSSDTTLNATGLTTITSSGTLGVSATQFNLGAGAPATIGTVSDDNLTLSPNGTGNLVLASDFNSSVFVGNASTPAPLSISGGIGNNSALIVNQLNSGDIITASSSGVTRFRVTNTGELVIGDNNTSFFTTIDPASLTANRTLTAPNEDGTLCLQGSANCGFALAVENYWQLNNNLLSPSNTTYDFGVGGNATSSALFAITNVSSGNPIATLSASTNGNGISIDANNSTIQSLRNNTLTLGGGTTGNIVLDSGTGIINTPDLTANRAVFTDASSNLVTSALSSALLNTLTDETGTGVSVFNTSPEIITSLTTTTTNFSLLDANATTINFGSDATTINQGANGGILNLGNSGAYTIQTTTGGLTLNSGSNTLTLDSSDTTLNATGLTTITSSGTLGVSATQFNLGAGAPATIGTVSDDNLTLSPNGTGNLVLASDFNSSVFVGNASTPAPLSISGGIGNNSALIVNQLNSGDIITASSSGVTRFRVTNTGELVIGDNNTSFFTTIDPASLTANRTLTAPNEDGTLCLQGSANCGFALAVENYWQLNNNLLSPSNTTYDFAIGGIATTSAQFAVIGVSNDAPIATLSGSTNNGLSLDANNSTIQSLRNNTLTLGGSSTGDILIDGVTNINGNTDITGTLTSSGLVTANNGLSVTGATNINTSGASATNIGTGGTGVITIGNATSDLSLVDPQWSITGLGAGTFASITSLGTIDAQGDISDSTGNLTLNDAVDISGDLAVSGTSLTATNATTVTLGSTGADTIIIGNGGADTITIGGASTTGLSLTDDNWSITAAGVANFGGTGIAVSLSGASTTGIDISNAAAGGTGINISSTNITNDLNLQNGETIDNNIDNTLNLGFGAASGILSLTSATNSVINASSRLDLQADGAIDVNIAGGSTATGCTITNTNGNLECTGTVTANGVLLTQYWDRTLGVLSPVTAGDAITTSGNISTSGTGTITSAGLLSGNAGLTVTGATNINTSGASATNIGTGGTGVITIGNATSDLSLVDPQWSITGLGAADFKGLTISSGIHNNCTILNTNGSGVVGCNTSTLSLGTNWWTTSTDNKAITPINSTMDLLLGGNSTESAKFAVLGLSTNTPVASVSSQNANGYAIYLDPANGAIQTLRNQTLTLGGSSTGDILIDGVTNINGNTDITGTLTSSGLVTANNGLSVTGATNINTSGASATNIGTGGTGVITIGNATSDLSLVDPQWSITGLGAGTFASITSLGTIDAQGDISDSTGNLTLNDAVDISGLATFNGGLTVASGQTTTLASFTNNNNSILYAGVSGVVGVAETTLDNLCLNSNGPGAAPTWGNCAEGIDQSKWVEDLGTLYPKNSTVDLLIGGSSTESAKFTILGVNTNTPVASVSSQNANGYAIYLDPANGAIQTLRNQTLTLGGSSTGDILIDGVTNINGNTDITGTLTSSGLVTANNGLSVTGATNINTSGASATNIGTGGTGVITIGNATSDLSLVDPQWSITGLGAGTFASITSLGTIDAQGDISDSTGNLTLNDAVDISGDLAVSGTSLTATNATTVTLGSTGADTIIIGNGGADTITIGGASTTGLSLTDDNWSITAAGVGTFTGLTLTPNFDNCNALNTNGSGVVGCNTSTLSLGTNWWTTSTDNKAITPINSTMDLLLGGNSTESAKFAVLGLSTNTPVASVSSQNANGYAIYLDPANGAIQTLRNQTLTLGGSSTGDILIDGVTNINGNTDITGTLTSSGLVTANNGLSVTGATNINTSGASATNIGTGGTGVITIGNATSDLSLVDPQWSITGLGAGTFASITSLGTIDAQGDISDSTGNLTLNDAVDISGDLAVSGTSLTATNATTVTLGSTGADTIIIGNGGADTITIGGASTTGLSLTDDNWSITAAGVGTFTGLTLTPNFDNCNALNTNGSGVVGCNTSTLSLGTNWWTTSTDNKAITPINSTMDLLLGGNSTESAKFAVLGLSTNTPVASVSSQNANGYAIYLDPANGAIQTLRNQTLTLGGSSTGDILIDGVTNINGNTDITGTLTSSGLVTANNGLSVTGATNINTSGASATNIGTGGTGVITIGNATSDLSLVDPQWSITGLGAGTFASITSLGTIDAQGDISDSTGNLTLNDAVDISGDLAVSGTSLTATNATTVTLGSTGADTIIIGNGGADTITIGGASTTGLSLTDDNWSITAAGVANFITGSTIATQTFSTNTIADSGILTINAGATGLNLQADGAIDVNIAGGSTATGCTITNTNGNLDVLVQ